MAETKSGLWIDRRATMTLNAFPPEDQARVRSTLGHLLGPTALEEMGGRVHRLPADEPLYSIRVPPDIRVIFTRRGDTIIVVDILRRGTLETFAAGLSVADTSGNPDLESSESLLSQSDLRRAKRRAKLHRGGLS
jgi:hypothetical protein